MREHHALFSHLGVPPTFLVTGGAGFIGSHLVGRFLEMGVCVTVLDDFSTGRLANLTPHAKLRIVEGSILDKAAVSAAAQHADLVFHLAAVVGMRRAHAHPDLTMRVSDEGTLNVLEGTANAPIVLMSSSSVYGLASRGPAVESDPLCADAALEYDGGRLGYASGKQRLESHGAVAMAGGRPVLTLRPFNVVGVRQRQDFGMVLPSFLHRARAGEPLEIHDDGLQKRSFSCVRAFVDCVVRLLTSAEAWQPQCNAVNVGTPVTTSVLELARIVVEATGSRSRLAMVPFEKLFPGRRDVRHRRPDCARLDRLIGPVEWDDVRSVVRQLVAAMTPTPEPAQASLVFAPGTNVVRETLEDGLVVADEQTSRYDADAVTS